MDSRATMVFIILVFAIMAGSATTQDVNPQHSDRDVAEFIKSSCNVTQYPQLCVSSLSPYVGSLKPRQSDLVKAAMNVSLLNARNVSVWADGLKTRRSKMSERERAALEDCIQNFEDTADEIYQSLTEMQHLSQNAFNLQMNDLQTWMSAALTYEDSCLGGFQKGNAVGGIYAMLRVRVQKVCEFISIALALVNAYAASREGNSINV